MERSSSIDSLSDDELYSLVETVSRDRSQQVGYIPSIDGPIPYLVWRIAPDAVAKLSVGPSEAYTMQFVRNNTSIPVPTVRRVLPRPADRRGTEDRYWIVMDYIEGNTLFDVWETFSEERRREIIDALARYVRELQAVRPPHPSIPGPLHPKGTPVKCSGSFFTYDDAGPFRSYQEMASWFDRQRSRIRIYNHHVFGGLMACPKFDASYPLVLCHMDIHPRNVLIDEAGTIWLLDWGYAGMYPVWFEYASIAVSVKADWRLAAVPAWKDLVANASTIAGDYARYYEDYLLVLFNSVGGINFDVQGQALGVVDDYFEKLGITVD
ncbi:hypothetical protein GSI_04512 [Ganoderma sinense ZZ0214-1]|uniref:Aminoglycoside phosphotransferase domain-containing protein n=1 Tax=Ganoderma sinense ZZ0214-1 TaxID=1077348 RepID=A0A2G8SH25_9APHY|nr:hypothetical protein GSI_04512 [Ganoderma sinense ZZ0214-1]